LIRLALEEINAFTGRGPSGLREDDLSELFFVSYARAIPQYDQDYCKAVNVIEDHSARHPRLHLVANYLKGVSLNDCIENAYQAAQENRDTSD